METHRSVTQTLRFYAAFGDYRYLKLNLGRGVNNKVGERFIIRISLYVGNQLNFSPKQA